MKVHLAKGTRDLLPAEMHRRLQVIETVREVFTRFGFDPIETPAMERIETLTGKYGDEGDKLLFRILKRGRGGERGEVDLGLRYDLTVPLARVVAMNGQLRMPFKRYQMQPVWRAERPQKGRFREFWQCDIDTVGCKEMTADAEAIAVVHAALDALGFTDFTIRINHRGLLRAMAEVAGVLELESSVVIAIDKLDKIGREGVTRELRERGVGPESIEQLWQILDAPEGAELEHLDQALGEHGAAALAEVREVLELAEQMGVERARMRFDPTLARGMSYYTGPVYETVVTEPKVGSISGGGRYDGLIGMFSNREIPAVGVSLGLERIIAVMEELDMLPDAQTATRVMVTVFNDELRAASIALVRALREAGIPAEVWLGRARRMGKQYKHANQKGIPWVATIGPDEQAAGRIQLKHLATGQQEELSLDEVIARVQED